MRKFLLLSTLLVCLKITQGVAQCTPPSTSSITGVTSTCAGAAVTYSVINTTGSSYSWTVSSGSITSGNGTNSIMVTWSSPWGSPSFSGSVTVVETTSGGCVGAAVSTPVTVFALPTASSQVSSICVGGSTSLTPNSGGTWLSTNPSVITVTNAGIATGIAPGSSALRFTSSSTGCSSNAVILSAVAPSTSAIVGNNKVCFNSTGLNYSVTNTSGSSYVWTITGGGVQVSGGNTNSITVNWGAAGSGSVKVVETNSSGCVGAQVNFPVTIYGTPVTSSILGGVACKFVNQNYSGYSVTGTSGSMYTWTATGGTPYVYNGIIFGNPNYTNVAGVPTSKNNISVAWTGTGSGTLNVVETNAGGCVGSPVSLPVTITSPTVSAPATQVCVGGTMTLSPATGGTWSSSNPAIATVTSAGVVTGQAVGSVVFTYTDATNGCMASTPSISVVKPATLNISSSSINLFFPPPGGSSIVCAGSTGIVYSVTNTPGSSYTWSVTGGGTITSGNGSNSISVNWGAAGSGSVTVTETLAAGCSGLPASVPVTINPLPATSVITGNTSPISTTASVYSVTNHSGSIYAWAASGATTVNGGSNSANITWGAAGPGNVKVLETTNNGCMGTWVNLPVTIQPIPLTSPISGPTTVCPYTQNVTYSVTNNPGSTYTWTITGGGPVTWVNTNSISVNWTGNGPASIQVVESNTAGYTCAPVTLPVTIATPTASSINGSVTVCGNATGVTYNVTNTPGSSYVWNIAGGTQASGGNTNSITVNWDPSYGRGNASAIGYVNVTETNSSGCTGNVVALPVTINTFHAYGMNSSFIGTRNNFCSGFMGQPFFTQSYLTSDPNPSTYVWTVAGGTQASGGNTNNITVNWDAAGPGSVSFVETNSSGCVSSPMGGSPLTINPTPVTSAITPTGVACSNGQWYASSYSVTNTPGNNYQWSAVGGTSSQWMNSTNVSWGAAGSGSVTVVESNQYNCAGAPVTLPVTINPSPITSTITGSTNTCEGTTANVYSVINTAGSTYSWSTNNGGYVTIEPTGSTTNRILVDFIFPWTYSYSTILSVTEKNAAGCSGNPVSLTINSTYPNTSTITGSANVCPNATGVTYSVTNTTGSTYAWTVIGGAKASGGTTNSITVNWGPAGTGTVQVVETNSNGCSGGTMSRSVTIAPATSSITGSTSVCQNSTLTYSVVNTTGSTYQWTPTGGSVVSGNGTNTVTINWTTAGSGNVKVVETNSSGCVGAPVNLPVTINTPNTSAITGINSVCINTNGVAYSVTNTTGSSYSWNIIGGSVASGQGTSAITVNWTTAGAGSVKVIETSVAGCVGAQVSKSVTVNPLPVTSPITGPSPICANTTGAVYSVTNTTGSTYAWTVTGTTGSTLVSGNGTSSIVVNWGVAGTGTVKIVETNVNGCVGVAVTKSVTINANPNTSAISGSATACPNSTGNAYSVTNTVGSTYNWIITGGTKATGGTTSSITVTWGIGGAGNVSVVETNAAGCVGTTINKAVTVSPLTSPISGSVTVCPNSNGLAYSVANVTGDTYTWTATGGAVVCGQNTSTILVNWGATGSGTLSVTERTATCTGVPVSLPVAITATPSTGVITGSAAVCSSASGVTYSVTNTSGSTYAWTVSGGTLVSGNGSSNILVNWSTSGTGNVSVVETSSTGCVGTAVNKLVTIGSPTTSGIAGNTNLCVPSNGITYSVTNTPGSTYAWAINGGTPVASSTTNSITVNWGPSGSGSVRVTETNSAGCVGATVSQVVTVNPTPATSAIAGNNSVCLNATGVSYSVTNTPGSTYVWTISGGTPAATSATNSIAVNWGGVGSGNVNVVETNNFGCVGLPVNLPVTINALPIITVTPASATISSGGSVNLTASGASTFSWSPSTGLSATTGVTVSAHPTVTTTYTVTGTTNGCSGTKPVTVTVGCTPPVVSISYPYGLNVCTGIVLTASAGSSYLWSTGETTQSIYPDMAGGYTVTVYNALGCSASASVTATRSPLNCAIARVAAGTQPTKPTESEDEPKGHKISVHPNPANHEVIVETPKRAEQDTQVVLYDMMGRVSGSGILKKGEWQVTISTNEVANGMYVVRIGTGDQANAERVIIEHK